MAAFRQGYVHIVGYKCPRDCKEETDGKGSCHHGEGDITRGFLFITAVDLGRFLQVIGYAHKACDINQHQITGQLPHCYDNQCPEGLDRVGQPGGGKQAEACGIADYKNRLFE